MGNPLSSVLINLYIEFLKKIYTKKCTIKDSEIVWLRYIDDILCLWPNHKPIIKFFNQIP